MRKACKSLHPSLRSKDYAVTYNLKFLVFILSDSLLLLNKTYRALYSQLNVL